jgi:putative oxidoreductase
MEGQEMDWKRLVQFALLGSSDLEQYAILLVRVSIGLFFAISGANKLFVAGSTQTMYKTLVEAKVPLPHLMAYLVSGVEFVGGSLPDRLFDHGIRPNFSNESQNRILI